MLARVYILLFVVVVGVVVDAKVGVLRASHKIFLSLRVKFE
jgi:hypothetical protein